VKGREKKRWKRREENVQGIAAGVEVQQGGAWRGYFQA